MRINLSLTFSEANAIISDSKNKSITRAILDGKFDEFKKYIATLPGSILINMNSKESPIHRIISYDKNDDSCRVKKDNDIRWFSRQQMIDFVHYLNDNNAIVFDNEKYQIIWNESIVKHVCDNDQSASYNQQGICFPLIVPKIVNGYKTELLHNRDNGDLIITTDEESDAVKSAQAMFRKYTESGDNLFQEVVREISPVKAPVKEDENSESENKRIDDSLFDDIIKEQPF